MYENRPRRKLTKKAIIVFTAIFIALAVLVIGIVMITNSADVEETIVQLPFSEDTSFVTAGNYTIYMETEYIKSINVSLSEAWQIHLLSSNLNLVSTNNKIIATGNDLVQVVDAFGEQYFTRKVSGNIISSRVCDNKAAVFVEQTVLEETLSYIFVFDMSGNVIYQLEVTERYILDYGFDNDSDLLYILELDTSGVVPISRISTFRPETQSMTSVKELKDQLIKRIYIIDSTVYALGTNQLIKYKSLGENEKEIVVYGWIIEDFYLQDQNDPKFVYIPSNADKNSIDIVRIIRSNGNETSVNLPPDVFRILYIQDKLYCFTKDKIYSYTSNGKFLQTLVLPFSIDSANRASDGYVFLTAENKVYLMPLS